MNHQFKIYKNYKRLIPFYEVVNAYGIVVFSGSKTDCKTYANNQKLIINDTLVP